MSRKCHNPWTHTFHSQVQKGVMDRKGFFNERPAAGRFVLDRKFSASIAKLEKLK